MNSLLGSAAISLSNLPFFTEWSRSSRENYQFLCRKYTFQHAFKDNELIYSICISLKYSENNILARFSRLCSVGVTINPLLLGLSSVYFSSYFCRFLRVSHLHFSQTGRTATQIYSFAINTTETQLYCVSNNKILIFPYFSFQGSDNIPT